MKQETPKLGTKEFNNLAMEMFGGKPKQQTAVEWLVEQFDLEMQDDLYLTKIKQAKEIEKQQQGYSVDEVEDLIYKICGTVARLQGITLNGNHINTAYNQHKTK
jgi:hypothetical protein